MLSRTRTRSHALSLARLFVALLFALPVPAPARTPLPVPTATAIAIAIAITHPLELTEAATGHFDVGKLVVFGYSADAPDEDDPQVYGELKPDMVLRSWFADRGDDTPLDGYNVDFRDLCQRGHIVFMAGLNATAIYPGQAANLHEFQDWATQDAQGKPVTHPEYEQPQYLAALRTAPPTRGDTGAGRLAPPVMQRASLAGPRFRARLMKLMEAQIDLGADGIVLAESDALGYRANADKGYNGDEGYDRYSLGDFNRFLMDKYPDYIEANWEIQFQMATDNTITPWLPWTDPTNNFNYQRYLQSRDWTADPRDRAGLADRPLAGEWGDVPYPAGSAPSTGFLAKDLAFYQAQMILKIRKYARSAQHREIVVAAQGMLPDVDVNEFPLTLDNRDDGGKPADYLPLTWDGSLDGSRSLLPVFKSLRQRSRQASGKALLVLYLALNKEDYARPYAGLTEEEKEDYWRLYVPEAYACGAFLAFHLRESLGQQPSSAQAGVLGFMTGYAGFYKRNRDLFTGAEDGGRGVKCDDGSVACNVTEQDYWRRSLVHLINHNYDLSHGIRPQTRLTVTVASAIAPAVAYMKSPDFDGSTPVAFSFRDGQVTLTVPTLAYYDILVLKWPVAGPRSRDEVSPQATPTQPPSFPSAATATPTQAPTRTPTRQPAAPLPAPAALAAPGLTLPVAPPIPALPAGALDLAPPAAATPMPTPISTPMATPAATPLAGVASAPAVTTDAAPCVPGVMTVKRKVWTRPVIGDTRSLGLKDSLRLGRRAGDLPEYALPFTLTASARVWAEADIQAGLVPDDTNGAPKVFLDDTFLGFLLVTPWRSPAALMLSSGAHRLTVRISEAETVPTVTLSRVRVVSDDGGHWAKVTETQPCGCGGPPCPEGKAPAKRLK